MFDIQTRALLLVNINTCSISIDKYMYNATLYCGRWWPVSRQNVLIRSIIHHFPCLKRVYFAVNIGNLLVQLVD